MATERSKDNITDLAAKGARRAAEVTDDVVRAAEGEIEAFADDVLPERKYSLNALIAAGVLGFVVGRVISR